MQVWLQSSNQTYILPKKYIQTSLPESLFASVLGLDPDVETLPITQPVVTPEVVEVLVNLSRGVEPVKAVPQLAAAAGYLGILGLLYYADPLYDEIPNRANVNAPENRLYIDQLIKLDRGWLLAYLLAKGWIPQNEDLIKAAENGATQIFTILLRRPEIHLDVTIPTNETRFIPLAVYEQALMSAGTKGNLDIMRLLLNDLWRLTYVGGGYIARQIATACQEEAVKLLLNDERFKHRIVMDGMQSGAVEGNCLELFRYLVGRAGYYSHYALDYIVHHDRYEMLKWVLANPGNEPAQIMKQLFDDALGKNKPEIARIVMAHPAFDPTMDDYDAFRKASWHHRPEIIRKLLAHPLVDPSTRDNVLARRAIQNGNTEVLKIYLQDPRVDPSANDNRLLERAFHYGYRDIIDMLLRNPRVQAKLTPEDRATYQI